MEQWSIEYKKSLFPEIHYSITPALHYSITVCGGDESIVEQRPMVSLSCRNSGTSGFTLLEVMVAVALIAIALVAVLGSQSQSLSLASEAKFSTTASFLAHGKMAEIEAGDPHDLTSDSGDFGEDFPGYRWDLTMSDVVFDSPENVSDYLKQFDLIISWGEDGQYEYGLRLYRFMPETG
ncbi:MAG: prepilin-type N-terminal cleavage/methylation domain-containing protein [Desulfobacterales bacterium]|nr:prepilin-type N-terminal cleavage/methylation domain-containing protein [Desulfobacterales bacterium]